MLISRPFSILRRAPAGVVLLLCVVTCGATASGGTLLLVGGGGEGSEGDTSAWSYQAYSWFVEQACSGGPNGGNCSIAIIDYEAYPDCHTANVGYCAYFEWIGSTLGQPVDAEALFVKRACTGGDGPECVRANAQATHDTIVGFDGIWLRGGDQGQYYAEWVDTRTEDAIAFVFHGGGVVGGTSAGAMILSEHTSIGDATSYEATADAYHARIDLRDDMFAGSNVILPDVIVDTHLTERARLGRSAVFVGRTLVDHGGEVLGVGLDSETALAVDPNSRATVIGQGAVSFLRTTETSQSDLTAGQAPYLTALAIDQLTEGFVFDLSSRSVAAVPAQAEAAGTPASTIAYGAATLQGNVDGDKEKGSHFASWAGAASASQALARGELTLETGTGDVDGGVTMTLLESSSTLREVRAGGPQWVLKEQAGHGIIVYTDGFGSEEYGRVQVRTDETLEVLPPADAPEESVIVYDCIGMQHVSQSSWDVNGNGQPRQSVALTPCHLSLLSSQTGQSIYDAVSHGVPSQVIGRVRGLSLAESAGVTTLNFVFDVPGAAYYQVIRGDTANLSASGELGPVVCIASAASPFDVHGGLVTDAQTPPSGTAWFFLVRGAGDPGVRGSFDGPGSDRDEDPVGDCP